MKYDILQFQALDSQVLVVAIYRIEGAWCAFIGPCPGESHEDEIQDVAASGTKLPEKLARFLFPYIGFPYAR